MIYDVICEICHDREYIYPCFLEVFGELTSEIYGHGGSAGSGTVTANGIKSDCMAVFEWSLLRRLDLIGHNELTMICKVCNKHTGSMLSRKRWIFDVSTGEIIVESEELS